MEFGLVLPAERVWEGDLHVMRKPVEPAIRTTHMGHSVLERVLLTGTGLGPRTDSSPFEMISFRRAAANENFSPPCRDVLILLSAVTFR